MFEWTCACGGYRTEGRTSLPSSQRRGYFTSTGEPGTSGGEDGAVLGGVVTGRSNDLKSTVNVCTIFSMDLIFLFSRGTRMEREED